jgi:DNA-binding transcriptional regulator of glucitol operon
VLASSRTSRRLAIAGVCLASLLVCCALAWWQWVRYSSATGTLQNLGYVLQWPVFGLFPAFMFWRIRQLNRRAAEAGAHTEGKAPAPEPQPSPPSPAQPSPLQPRLAPPAEVDDELAAYNRYLAELNSRDQQNS